MKQIAFLFVATVIAVQSSAQINYAHNGISTLSTYVTVTIDDDLELGVTTAFNAVAFAPGSVHVAGGVSVPPL